MRLKDDTLSDPSEAAARPPAGGAARSDAQGPGFGAAARAHFMLEEGAIYLNHGAYGALSRPVSQAQSDWGVHIERHPSRFMRTELPGLMRRTADGLGAYVGARGEDVVFLDNATTAINAVLRSFMLMPGDEVVTTSHCYSAVMRTLEFVCDRADARLIVADLPFPIEEPGQAVDAVIGALSPRTRLLVVDHATSKTALVLPVAEITAEARDRGVAVLIDGAHGPGMLPLEIEALGADYYAANAHKWLGAPRGAAMLWAAPERQPHLRPTTISHFVADGFTAAFDWPGTKDFTPVLSIPAALEFRARWGEAAIAERCTSLAREAARHLARDLGTERGGPDSMTAFMAAVALPPSAGAKQPDADRLRRRLLEEAGIEVDLQPIDRRLWLRLCAYLYNEPSEYEALAAALKRML
ncbi:MAG: aminotransferase class V-fold PLP-dependent enzyme [Alphaproteobacteria bacterium]|nr:aminotransferase class V-fold PLP-dependent enzyme [Alphaproteobacteria bacterium]